MQKDSYRNGINAGKATRKIVNLFRNIRQEMLAKAGQSKLRIIIANISFIIMLIASIGFLSLLLYYSLGVISLMLIVFISIYLPKISDPPKSDDDNSYSFEDGYRDGPEGFGYYSGGYKVDD